VVPPSGAYRRRVLARMLARMIHESTYYGRRRHVSCGRTRAALLDVLSCTPPVLALRAAASDAPPTPSLRCIHESSGL